MSPLQVLKSATVYFVLKKACHVLPVLCVLVWPSVSDSLRLASLSRQLDIPFLFCIFWHKAVWCSCFYVDFLKWFLPCMWLFCSWVHCFCWVVDIASMQQWKLFIANAKRRLTLLLFFSVFVVSCSVISGFTGLRRSPSGAQLEF